ncbi:MAG: competence/damage-inducible protein A, partial [Oscillospiraceae bacterium]|nr:competence/damage-inducible protein A [Oscillospiraceae bacterium]
MRAEIICVGDELLRGYVVNTNSAYLSQRLAGLGYDVNFQTVVGDSEKDIFDAIRMAVTRSHIIIFTGGLGPTADDMTKEVVAKALGMRLIFDETTAANLEGKLGMSSDEMSEAQLKQAYVIDGCTVLKNENGTAPGILLQKGNQVIVLMPGPPAEMKPMFENSVKPLLMSFSDVSCASATLRVVGLREPAVEETLGGLLYGANPHAALYVSSGEVLIRVFAKGADQAEADTKCAEHVSKIREVLGSYVYGEGDRELNEVVVNLLKDH